jgi:pimeloyl-ACP methyl ester carboxylesterase
MSADWKATGVFEAPVLSQTTSSGDSTSQSLKRFKRRHVYHLAGYDAADSDAQYQRFIRQLGRFKRTWPVQTTLSELERSRMQSRAWWTVQTYCADWQVATVHEILSWNDIVLADFARPWIVRVTKAVAAYFEFITTGTFYRYVKANYRYSMFFFFPLFLLTVFGAGAWVFGCFVGHFFQLAGPGEFAVRLIVGVAVFFSLLQWPGRYLRLQHALDVWIFARDYVHDRRSDINARLDVFANVILARAREAGIDEIVLVGHSLGATLAIDLLDRALTIDPAFGCRGPAICLLTVGATIPKFALHPAATRLRRATARIAAEPSIAWAEFQARVDIISFYTYDPATLTRTTERLSGKPVIRHVQIDQMLTPASYARHRRRYLRLHYQPVMANERRAPYDYFMMACGPILFRNWTISPTGVLDFLRADGSLCEPFQGRSPLVAVGNL